MTELQRQSPSDFDQRLGPRQHRRWIAETRHRTQLNEFAEYAEAARLDARLLCARRLADVAASELALLHEEFNILAGGNAGLEMDLREIEQTFKIGCVRALHQYMGRR